MIPSRTLAGRCFRLLSCVAATWTLACGQGGGQEASSALPLASGSFDATVSLHTSAGELLCGDLVVQVLDLDARGSMLATHPAIELRAENGQAALSTACHDGPAGGDDTRVTILLLNVRSCTSGPQQRASFGGRGSGCYVDITSAVANFDCVKDRDHHLVFDLVADGW